MTLNEPVEVGRRPYAEVACLRVLRDHERDRTADEFDLRAVVVAEIIGQPLRTTIRALDRMAGVGEVVETPPQGWPGVWYERTGSPLPRSERRFRLT